ncbi:MAG: exopolysaccharide biosynthesis protein [Coleofasciculaceae cyanobacterium RL_1_1]|nr:exopolysaccharide biosynthesis protein [Coleofasciculaceae cyanobacterium RL_1_1]
MAKLSTELDRTFLQSDRTDPVKLRDLFELAGERTFGFLFVLLSLPSALPLPAPGYSVPFGILLFVLAVQLLLGSKQPWLPEKWLNRDFDRATIQGFLTKGMPWLQRIEIFSRPRLTVICTSRIGHTVLGLTIVLLSISMMIPIPGTNTVPAMGIFAIGFGLLDDDGFVASIGLTIGAIGLTLTSLILRFGYEAVSAGIDVLKAAIKAAF